jgi:hypothetical protein
VSTGPFPVLDATQLRRLTLGNPAFEVEVLALFSAELERLLRQLDEAGDKHVQAERLRAIIALARNTGASRLLHEARLAETRLASGGTDLALLRQAASDTLAYVRHG